MTDAGNRPLLLTMIGLGLALFALDLYLPLGIGNGVLYGGLVILSFWLPNRSGPVITASICSALSLADVWFSRTLEGVPMWMGVTNRLFSLTAIWLPVLFFLHRRRAEESLRRAHDELEVRVESRTQELAAVNRALVQEIAERVETERSLRTSESTLQASQQELLQSQEDLRALAGQLLTAQEEDRRRISRDLHDDINQRLAMLSMDLRQADKNPASNLDTLHATLQLTAEGLSSISDDVRQMAYRFHPSILDDLGLIKAVRRLLEDFSIRNKIPHAYLHHESAKPLPAELAICIYRVVQESLSNVARHAQASRVEVELIGDDDQVHLSVRDDGRGFEASSLSTTGTHLGLLSMRERVRLAKGHLEIHSTPGHGTTVIVTVPIHQEAARA